jgi:hypothetical protein
MESMALTTAGLYQETVVKSIFILHNTHRQKSTNGSEAQPEQATPA